MYSYKPSKQDPRIKTIFGLIKDDHINTLNQDFKALRRTLGMNKEYSHIHTRDEPIECRMIEGIEDLLKYTEKDENTMFYKGKLYYQSNQAGYNHITFCSGNISYVVEFQVQAVKRTNVESTIR